MDTTVLNRIHDLLPRQSKNTIYWGKQMARFKNEMGFPPDMFLKRLNVDNDTKFLISITYCDEMIEHKRASGAQEKAIDKTRKHNQAILRRLLDKGELGEY